jgi:hypothetical protein
MKRLLAFVVSLAVLSAPLALEICQVTCESNAIPEAMLHGADGHVDHHAPANHAACHEHGGPQHQLWPIDGPCDHGADATPSLVAGRSSDRSITLPATLPAIASIGVVPIRTLTSVRESRWPDRPGSSRAIPLRV